LTTSVPLPPGSGRWIGIAIGAAFWYLALAPIVTNQSDQHAIDSDPTCAAAVLGRAAAVWDGACTIVDAKVADSGIVRTSGRYKRDFPFLVIALPDGTSHRVDVIYDLYGAALANGPQVRAQLFDRRIFRLKAGKEVDETSESPRGRIYGNIFWTVIAIWYTAMAVLILTQNAKKRRLAGASSTPST
jgi:hypothetical protein